MEFIPYDSFPDMHKQIIDFKLEDNYITYQKWIDKVKEQLDYQFYPKSLCRFIMRTAMGHPWTPHNETGGNLPYLCPADFEELKIQSHERCASGTHFIEQDDFIEMAMRLKTIRILNAVRFLKTINCIKLASFLGEATELEPSRQWIQVYLQKLDLEFISPKNIEATRIESASIRLNMQFFIENEDIITLMAKYANGAVGTISASRVATGRKNYLTYEIQGTQGSVFYNLERMGEVQVYFQSDEERDRGFRTVLLNPKHKGYSAFQPAGGISIAYNDMKILEVHQLFAALTKGEPYNCNFEFGYKIDRTVAAILESAKKEAWVDVK